MNTFTLAKQSLSALAAVFLALAPISSPTAYADEASRLILSPIQSEFVVGDPESTSDSLTVEVFVTGSTAAEIGIEFIDFYRDEQGETVTLPGGSVPYSLANALEVTEYDKVYRPSQKGQKFLIELKPKTKKLNSIYQGGIKVVMRPIASSGEQAPLSSSGSIVSSLTVTPFGFTGSLADGQILGAQITKHTLTPLLRSSFIDSLIPDIPGLVNFGPVESKVTYENLGSYPTFTSISWEFSEGKEVLASQQIPSKLLSPGSSETVAVSTEIKNEVGESNLNVLPPFGLVQSKIVLQSRLGGTSFEPNVITQNFTVIQWKEPLVILVGLLLVIRWALRKNLSAKQKEQTQSLLYLAIKGAFKKIKKALKSKFSKEKLELSGKSATNARKDAAHPSLDLN